MGVSGENIVGIEEVMSTKLNSCSTTLRVLIIVSKRFPVMGVSVGNITGFDSLSVQDNLRSKLRSDVNNV